MKDRTNSHCEDQAPSGPSDGKELEALIREGHTCDRCLTEAETQILEAEYRRIQFDFEHPCDKSVEVEKALRRLRISAILQKWQPTP